jgi:predicted MFS family arabinose efflux permease
MMAKREGEWRTGWTVVLAAAFGYSTSTLHATSLGAMVKPLSTAFGWTRGEITAGMMFLPLFGIFTFPLIGRLADRIGSRKVALTGLCLFTCTLASIGFIGPSIWSWYAAWAVLAFLFCAISTNIWATPVVGRFERNRGVALGLMLCGSGIANTVIPPMVVAITQDFGWRGAYWAMAAIPLLLTLPLAIMFFKDVPRGGPHGPQTRAATETGMTLGEAARTLRFWKICVSLTLAGGIATALQVHLQPMMIDQGVSPLAAAAAMSVFGPSLLIGRFGVGLLLDRIPGTIVASVALAAPAVSMLLMMTFDGALWRGMVAAGFLGLCFGADVDLVAYLSSRYFGLKHFSAIHGALLAALTIGLGLAPGIVGYAYDNLGSYTPALIAMTIMSLVGSAIAATLGKYPAAYQAAGH